ncbi:MAG: hypothetical protein IJ379_05215 [Lachnospiraceae bacterium]|nr:hypothetical protein [Lachnospiraceae bacterium]
MAQIIDITGKITNELPMVRITEQLVVTVNNRKNTILNMQAMVQETQKKSEDGTFDEVALMNKTLCMLIGEKAVTEIEEMDVPFPEYKIIYQAVMAAATGSELEEVEKRFQE